MQLDTKTASKALFGGAFMAAGLNAQAQVFQIDDIDPVGGVNPSFAISQAVDNGASANDLAYAPAALNTYSTGYDTNFGNSYHGTFQDSTVMRAYAGADLSGAAPFGVSGGTLQAFFQVSQAGTLTFDWDWTLTDNYAQIIFAENGGAVLFNADGLGGAPAAGSQAFPVVPGTDYVVQLRFNNNNFLPYVYGNGNFIQATLTPTPGALAVFGMAGVAATRRRR